MKKIIIANWKMQLTYQQAEAYAKRLRLSTAIKKSKLELVVCPDHLSLPGVSAVLRRSQIGLGAQNAAHLDRGPQTGEISPRDLKSLELKYVILGHSERRLLGERPSLIAAKVRSVLAQGLKPVVCIGEKLLDKESGETRRYLSQELRRLFSGLKLKRATDLIIAYEPVWAISSFHQARALSPFEANSIHEYIKQRAAKILGKTPRVIYGGSVNGDNAAEFLRQTHVSGLLVGAASLDFDVFIKICQ